MKARIILATHLTYIALCILWNLVGVWQIQNGLQSIGPTASLLAAAVLALIAGIVYLSARKRWLAAYVGFSALLLLAALVSIYGGFTKSADHWPSGFWRVAGIIVNSLGVVGFALLVTNIRTLKSPTSQR